MKKHIIVIVLLLASLKTVSAQQDAQYTQYIYNTLSINPAYAGSREVLSITALHRSQWVGLDGSPKTQTLSLNTPASERVGLGLSIVHDEIGNSTKQETIFDAVFSYTIPTSYNGNLSFGLKAGGDLLNLDFSKLSGYINEQGTTGLVNVDQKFSPNFGAGVYYYTDKLYVGFSVPNFLETEHFDQSNTSSFLTKDRISYYLMSGFVFDLNPYLKFKPAVLLKSVAGAPIQADFSANFMFNDKFTLGVGYRWDAALSALVGFQITDGFMIGIAYDKEITDLGSETFNDGSFEIVLRYEFVNHLRNLTSPRFF